MIHIHLFLSGNYHLFQTLSNERVLYLYLYHQLYFTEGKVGSSPVVVITLVHRALLARLLEATNVPDIGHCISVVFVP